MFIPVRQPLDLASTLESGQAFRWKRVGEWSYGVAFDNVIKIRQLATGIEFFSSPDNEGALKTRLIDYLGLPADLDRIYGSIGRDERVRDAIDRYPGMRVLRQDPWECLVSFICSANSNIARISRNVEDLCDSLGRPLRLGGHVRSTFPTAAAIASAGEDYLRRLGLGFRAGYVASTARVIADGGTDLMVLRGSSYADALAVLTELTGVGDKVANCVLLFSLDKPEAFPVDVWINRAVREWYLGDRARPPSPREIRLWAMEYFGPYAGYANQYLFHDRRLRGRGGT